MSTGGLRKHSVSIRGHATSYTLEDEFFVILNQIAETRGQSIAALVAEVDSKRERTANLSSALRLHVLNWLKSQIPSAC
ncbi:ribbon-helix-helix domain-containing protein [Ochrobactrum sp. RH2CCR150]|uniref:ribbon-helix-helix domain-containing protein n=1 Tax=Ochrobactrum sp. RH2CCR150 TaxID=2587044 RepID=UPI0015FC3A26|nr:putative DNA-binding ribbon-helix-helix protein [Ochrobactrum sp. RH2CCR150]URQ75588.1 MAG: ribbon-helix-helix domain-containing protein [Candidatus Ochrobactrum gambitense]WEK15625.1 MAG: ribbon-helix-helix domain-containing protein [Candidatus Ochrobactrum gambitense]